MKILIIIPVYNEEENIETVIEQLVTCDSTLDYVIVNDCSNDKTKDILVKHNYNFLSLPVNLGIGGGVQAGYIYALENDYDIAIQLDGDGQHNSSEIPKLIKPIQDGLADIVIGSRFLENKGFQSSVIRRVGISFLSKLIKIMTGIEIKDVTSGFRAVNKKFIKLFADNYAQDYPEPEAIILGSMYTSKIIEVPVIMNERIGGKSSISPIKSVYYMFKVSIAVIIQRIILKKQL